jgi:uncharacterized membrane protein (UPF0127 family)
VYGGRAVIVGGGGGSGAGSNSPLVRGREIVGVAMELSPKVGRTEYRQVHVLDPVNRAVLIRAEEARGVFQRMRGLRGRAGLSPGEGLAMRTKQVHTIGMTFSIDAIYVSRRGSVLKVANLAPGQIGPLVPRAKWVVEVGAGEAGRLGIGAGTRLEILRDG